MQYKDLMMMDQGKNTSPFSPQFSDNISMENSYGKKQSSPSVNESPGGSTTELVYVDQSASPKPQNPFARDSSPVCKLDDVKTKKWSCKKVFNADNKGFEGFTLKVDNCSGFTNLQDVPEVKPIVEIEKFEKHLHQFLVTQDLSNEKYEQISLLLLQGNNLFEASQPKKSSFGIRKSIHAVQMATEMDQGSPSSQKGPQLKEAVTNPVMVSLPNCQVDGYLSFGPIILNRNHASQKNIGFEKLTKLNFLPQSEIERLLLETICIDQYGLLQIDLKMLTEELERDFEDIQAPLRRTLQCETSLDLIKLSCDLKTVQSWNEIPLEFPQVRFTSADGQYERAKSVCARDLIDLIMQGSSSQSWQEQSLKYFDQLLSNQILSQPEMPRSQMVSLKLEFAEFESILIQKRWLAFDLKCGSQKLATFECSEHETYLIIQAAIEQNQAVNFTSSLTMLDLLRVFAEKCKISQSEVLNKWMIALDSDNMSPFEANLHTDVAIKDLEMATLQENTINHLQAHLIIDKETVLDRKSPASSRSRSGSSGFDSSEEVKEMDKPVKNQSSFSAMMGNLQIQNHAKINPPSSKPQQAQTVLSLHMRPANVTLQRKLSQRRSRKVSDIFGLVSQFSIGTQLSNLSLDSTESKGSSVSSSDSVDNAKMKEAQKPPALIKSMKQYICFQRAESKQDRNAWVQSLIQGNKLLSK